MPTQTAVQDVSSPPRFGRAMRKEPWDGFHEPMRSTELTGAPMSFARNVEIYRENDRADRLYKVVSGTVRTCKILIDGRRQIAAFYLPGDTFGLAPAATHMFSAEAASDAKVLVIKRGVVASLQLGGLMRRELQLAQGHFLLPARQDRARAGGQLPAGNGRSHPIRRRSGTADVAPGHGRLSRPHHRNRITNADATSAPIGNRAAHLQAGRAAQPCGSATAHRLSSPPCRPVVAE
jgi:CRP-like cAMP-binding protein